MKGSKAVIHNFILTNSFFLIKTKHQYDMNVKIQCMIYFNVTHEIIMVNRSYRLICLIFEFLG